MDISDRTLKENIEPIKNTGTLLELMPVQFTLKGGSKLQYGFIAQDMEETEYANLVYSNRDGIKSVAYTQLISVLTQHIQNLTERVEKLEAARNRNNPEFP
jgi:hypothetical protein